MESHLLASPFPFPQTKAQSGLADLPHGASGKVGSSRPGILNFGRVSGKNKGRGEFGVFPIRRMYKYICHNYAKYFSPFLSIYKLQNVLEACLTCPSCCCASTASGQTPNRDVGRVPTPQQPSPATAATFVDRFVEGLERGTGAEKVDRTTWCQVG